MALDDLLKSYEELGAKVDKYIESNQTDADYNDNLKGWFAELEALKSKIENERKKKSAQEYKEALGAMNKSVRKPVSITDAVDAAIEEQSRAAAAVQSSGDEKFKSELITRAFCQLLKFSNVKTGENPITLAREWARKQGNFNEKEIQALGITDDTLGGYFAPVQFQERVIMNLPAISRLAALVTREPTASQTVVYPTFRPASDVAKQKIYPGTYSGSWAKEGPVEDVATRTKQNNPKTGGKSIEVKLWRPQPVVITHALMMDAKANFMSHVMRMIQWTYGLDLEDAIVNGDGVLEPFGIMNNASIAEVNSGNATAITQDGILDLVYSQPGQYAALPSNAFLMRRRTYGKIRMLKDPLGQYVYPQSIVPANTLEGYPVVFSEFMPAVGAGNYPIIFGPWEYYVVIDREEMQILPNSAVFQPDLCLIPFARIGGDVTMTDPFVKMKVSV